MNLDKYITENIDELIDNSNDILLPSYNIKKKKVMFDENNINSNYLNNYETSYDISKNNFNKEPNEDKDINYYIDDLYEKKFMNNFNNNFNNNNINNNNINNNIINSNKIIENEYNKSNDEYNKSNDDNNEEFYYINLINIFIKYYNNKYDKNENFFSNIKDINKDTSSQMEIFFEIIVEYKLLKKTLLLENNECLKIIYLEKEEENIKNILEKWENQVYVLEINDEKFISPSLLICLNYIYEKNILENDWNIYNLRNNN